MMTVGAGVEAFKDQVQEGSQMSSKVHEQWRWTRDGLEIEMDRE